MSRALFVGLSLGAGSLMAVASAAGIYRPEVYANETASWAAQGVGQDIVNLFVVFPALLLSAYLVARGSVRALLVWLGLLVYIVYSYVLYALFVHFNRLFLVYVAALGLAFWAFVGTISSLRLDRFASVFDRDRKYPAQVVYLMASGFLFAALWLSDIVPALASGTPPHDPSTDSERRVASTAGNPALLRRAPAIGADREWQCSCLVLGIRRWLSRSWRDGAFGFAASSRVSASGRGSIVRPDWRAHSRLPQKRCNAASSWRSRASAASLSHAMRRRISLFEHFESERAARRSLSR